MGVTMCFVSQQRSKYLDRATFCLELTILVCSNPPFSSICSHQASLKSRDTDSPFFNGLSTLSHVPSTDSEFAIQFDLILSASVPLA